MEHRVLHFQELRGAASECARHGVTFDASHGTAQCVVRSGRREGARRTFRAPSSQFHEWLSVPLSLLSFPNVGKKRIFKFALSCTFSSDLTAEVLLTDTTSCSSATLFVSDTKCLSGAAPRHRAQIKCLQRAQISEFKCCPSRAQRDAPLRRPSSAQSLRPKQCRSSRVDVLRRTASVSFHAVTLAFSDVRLHC